MKSLVGKKYIKNILDGKCIYIEQISERCLKELDEYLRQKIEGIIIQASKYLKSSNNLERLNIGHIRQAIKDADTPIPVTDAQKGYADLKRDFVRLKDEFRISEQRVEFLRKQNSSMEKRIERYEGVNDKYSSKEDEDDSL